MIPFSPPYISDDAIAEVVDTLKSGWITTGPKTKKFEQMIADYCGTEKTLCVNSATFGLELMLRWYGIGKGDEVIVPAYTYCASANIIMHLGAKAVLVDVNPDDFNISIEGIKNAINEKTKAILAVDLGGFPCDYESIFQLVNQKENKSLFTAKTTEQKLLGRVLVLTDAAHSLGATYRGKRSGSYADISVFSFHAVKNLTTAEGGAITFNLPDSFDVEELYKYLNSVSLHGQSKDALAKTKINSWKYDVIEHGYKGNMTDIQASLGISQLKEYNQILAKRKSIFDFYTQELSKYEWAELPIYETEEKISSYHLYLLRIKNIDEITRNTIISEIFENGVAVNVHYQPLPSFSSYQQYNKSDYPSAYRNSDREITLPVYTTLSNENAKIVIDTVISICEKHINKHD